MIQDRAICTIIAKNYLAYARTLAESFLSFHPDHKCYVLIVDDFEAYIDPADECFEIVRLTDLEIPDLPDFCFKYDVKELCTAVKAHLLGYLTRERSVERLLYFDPDILITAPLDELYEKLDIHDVVLTPHLDTDYPEDDLLPDDSHILRAGQFNLGFIGINSSENAQAFLNWWRPKLYNNCVVDVLHGYFVDQRFIDFVPILFENVLLEKNVGYNVAYWNLHSRRVSNQQGSWKCNDGPLYFFHFSGYDPLRAAMSSHIPSSLSRHRLSRRDDLSKLFAVYRELLIGNRYKEAISWPYSFGYFKSGEHIPDDLRPYYRSLPRKWRSLGDPFNSRMLKSQARLDPRFKEGNPGAKQGVAELTSSEQLSAILNSRAWRWVCRYGRFKNRYVAPVFEILRRLFGNRRPGTEATQQTGKTLVHRVSRHP